jgi:ABC-type polysaccharide/polyol phosphate export permease
MVPRTLRLVVDLNPLSGVVRAYRDILVTGHAPDWVALGYGAAFGVLLTGIGLDVVRRLSHDLAERL